MSICAIYSTIYTPVCSRAGVRTPHLAVFVFQDEMDVVTMLLAAYDVYHLREHLAQGCGQLGRESHVASFPRESHRHDRRVTADCRVGRRKQTCLRNQLVEQSFVRHVTPAKRKK